MVNMKRVRMRRDVMTSNGSILTGEVVTIDDKTATDWIRRGDAFEEKSYQPPSRKRGRPRRVVNG